MIEEVSNFLTIMKFVSNHNYKFERAGEVFFAAWLEFLVSVLIELANDIVLMCTDSSLDLISNFVALVIIA